MRHEPPPHVRLEAIFARDFDRRMRLVIDLLHRELRRTDSPWAASVTIQPRLRALSAAQSPIPGGPR
jgi:hypothetical protein